MAHPRDDRLVGARQPANRPDLGLVAAHAKGTTAVFLRRQLHGLVAPRRLDARRLLCLSVAVTGAKITAR